MTKDEALKLALEALVYASSYCNTYDAIDAVKQALAAPVQPDRTGMTYYRNDACTAKDAHASDCICWTPAQPAPVACKTLCELCVKRGYAFCANAAKTTPITTPPAQPAAWEAEMRAELVKLGFDGQCPESIGITIKGWFDAYAKSLAPPSQPAPVPLTDDARGLLVIEHLGPNALLHKPMSIYDAFHMGIDAAESFHGIT